MDNRLLDNLEMRPKRVIIGRPRADAPSERVLQRQIIAAGRGLGIRMIHVPNGVRYVGTGLDRARQAAVLKADGLVAGFPDIICIKPGGLGFGLIEVKREGGLLSEAQQRCIKQLIDDGVRVAIICRLDDVYTVWKGWGWL